MKEKLKERKGITLIALVVTIIVLLILAGVTIALVLGNNGIIKRAQEAKEQTTQTQNKEMEDLNNLENYMNDKIEGTETKPTGGISANDISKSPETYYGKEVKGYKLPSGTKTDVKWKIFYADGSNIYLITDNYVEKENLPKSTTAEGTPTENRPNDGDSKYARTAYFTNILNDYAGSASITDAKLQALNNDYFTKKHTSTNNNMKSVAYMMDTNAWNSKFKDVNNKAEYVIGGPTVELLFKSYNSRYKTAYESQASSDIGYQIRKTSNDAWTTYIASMLSTSDSLYVIKETTDAAAYWLASPSAYHPGNIVNVYYNGYVNKYSNDDVGFRPLVCLKSDIQLQKNEDGTYTIL